MGKRLKSKRPLLDTNVFIERNIPDSLLSRMALSSVVLYELIATTIDNTTLTLYSSWKSSTSPSNPLLTPTATDWFACAKMIRNMLRGQKSLTKGPMARITSAQQQQNDALIARTAFLNDCFVVTNNSKDFERFQPYMKGLIIVSTEDFFD